MKVLGYGGNKVVVAVADGWDIDNHKMCCESENV